ncbi:MAG: hypothetical protein MJB14_12155 [Spirochaetes bacterium]|nr:hypothetical protein [Spirochaetota bacterium]
MARLIKTAVIELSNEIPATREANELDHSLKERIRRNKIVPREPRPVPDGINISNDSSNQSVSWQNNSPELKISGLILMIIFGLALSAAFFVANGYILIILKYLLKGMPLITGLFT